MTRPEAVTAECWVCGVYLEQLPGTDVVRGLQVFRTHHPMTADARHDRRTPPGWREPLSGPGALSQ
jgi:hypothetical protein